MVSQERPEVKTFYDWESVQVLADPKRVRMLRVFEDQPRSTREAAEELGIKFSTLYHHVSHFHKLGLLSVARELRKRGTTERFFQTSAKRLMATAGVAPDSTPQSIFQTRFNHALKQIELAGEHRNDESPIGISVAQVRLTPRAIQRVLGRVGEYARAFESDDGVELAIMVVAYPESAELI